MCEREIRNVYGERDRVRERERERERVREREIVEHFQKGN